MGAGGKFVVVAGLIAAGAGAYAERALWLPQALTLLPAQFGGHGQGPNAEVLRDRSVPVVAAPVTRADVPVYVTGVGTAKPLNSVTVRAQVSGKLTEIDFREGQDLKKGDPIARLDDALYKAQRDQALAKKAQDQAVLVNAELELQRDERLVRSGAMTEQLLGNQRALVEQNRAQVAADAAAVEAAEAQLSYTVITAPINGRTGLRGVDIGNLVSSGDASGIVTLSQIRPIAVVFSVPQQDLARVNIARAAAPLGVEALSGEGQVVAEGELTVVDNQVDPTTGTVRLKAEFPNDTLALWPGAFVDTRLLVETQRNVLTVPSAAVQHGPAGSYAYVVSDGAKVHLRPLTIGFQDDKRAVVTGGVEEGESVVTSGFSRLQDGASVKVSSPEEADPAKLAVPMTEGGSKGGKHHKGKHGAKPAAAPAHPGGAEPAAPQTSERSAPATDGGEEAKPADTTPAGGGTVENQPAENRRAAAEGREQTTSTQSDPSIVSAVEAPDADPASQGRAPATTSGASPTRSADLKESAPGSQAAPAP
ncbi:efflux RND transporter periplasmic adaptor subunit [Aureimonas sp. N4]|uniref:efflux RND transporter periplasmic adaptor subunit n=1 Tax=Aureimonas sp. N4 TaxID=1638165 RepID=UPI0009EC51B5|nr:efflux RND transporter periplasmic adaptor subunit [Aureimonas sp. N4]